MMNASPLVPLFSPSFQELSHYIAGIEAPYTLHAIQGFNAIYKRVYALLSREETRRIEEFVDTMIDRVAQKEFAEKIFGVV
ncbi:MAG TPA: hypothetical protein VLU73_02950 [Methylococcaceae bacterium]|jgi:hypothetical protein|nr:hypothetical protein [Methylococcaceae bacterium]